MKPKCKPLKKESVQFWQCRISRQNGQSFSLKASLIQVKNIYISESIWTVGSENIRF